MYTLPVRRSYLDVYDLFENHFVLITTSVRTIFITHSAGAASEAAGAPLYHILTASVDKWNQIDLEILRWQVTFCNVHFTIGNYFKISKRTIFQVSNVQNVLMF